VDDSNCSSSQHEQLNYRAGLKQTACTARACAWGKLHLAGLLCTRMTPSWTHYFCTHITGFPFNFKNVGPQPNKMSLTVEETDVTVADITGMTTV